jgi:hypothetical protein
MPLRLKPVERIQFLQRSKQTRDVLQAPVMHNIQIECVDGSSIQNCGHTAYNDKINFVSQQYLKNQPKVVCWHGVR